LRNFCVICAKKIKLARKKSARKIFEFWAKKWRYRPCERIFEPPGG
jgi:hypothetical protein